MHRNPALAATTKIAVTVVGSLVILAGLVMMVMPGPGILGLIVGLAILSTEYEWAARWLARAKRKAHEARVMAEQMDPRVRRRRLLLAGTAILVVFGVVAAFVVAYGWPGVAVTGWNWVQNALGWAPELPGM
jgi:uncharacterized protein (TIGR02611 family)